MNGHDYHSETEGQNGNTVEIEPPVDFLELFNQVVETKKRTIGSRLNIGAKDAWDTFSDHQREVFVNLTDNVARRIEMISELLVNIRHPKPQQ